MTDQKQAPEQRDMKDICFTLRQTSLHRAAEIIEDLVKQRDELAAEVERLKVYRYRAGVADDKLERLSAKTCVLERKLKISESERDQALAASAAREIAMRDRAEDWLWEYMGTKMHGLYVEGSMSNALPLSPDGQQALNEMLADAWDEGHDDACAGWRAGEPNPYRKDAT